MHRRLAPYFVDTVATPWGDALNVAEAGSDTVRRTILESACRWIEDFHVDGLRVDAVHAIHDPTARPFLAELTAAVHDAGAAAGRTVLVIAESSDNDPRLLRPDELGGSGFDAVWDDDVHHAVARRADRGPARLLRRLRRRRGRGDGARAPLALRRSLLGVPRPPARTVRRRAAVRAVRRLHEQPRPRRQHARRRPPARTTGPSASSPRRPSCSRRSRRCCSWARSTASRRRSRSSSTTATRACWRPRARAAGASSATSGPRTSPTRATRPRSPAPCSTRRWRRPSRTAACSRAYTELLALRRRIGVLRGDAEQVVTRHGDTVVVDRRRDGARSLLVLGFGAEPNALRVDAAGLTIVFDSDDRHWGGDGATSVLDDGSLAIGGTTAVLLTTADLRVSADLEYAVPRAASTPCGSGPHGALGRHHGTRVGEDDGGEGGEGGGDVERPSATGSSSSRTWRHRPGRQVDGRHAAGPGRRRAAGHDGDEHGLAGRVGAGERDAGRRRRRSARSRRGRARGGRPARAAMTTARAAGDALLAHAARPSIAAAAATRSSSAAWSGSTRLSGSTST